MNTGGQGRPIRAEIGATLSLAWPLVLSNLAAIGFGTIDLMLIGRLGGDAIAAGALATALYHAVFTAMMGVVSAVAPLVAAEYGRRRHAVREIRRTVRQGLWVAVAASVPAIAFLSCAEYLFRATGQDAQVAADAAHYLAWLQWAMIPSLLFIVLRTFTASIGRPGWGLAISLLGLPINAALAALLIFGGLGVPALGLKGAGIATTATNLVGLVIMIAVCMRAWRFRRYHLMGRFWRADWPRFGRIWAIGLPIALTLAMETSLFTASGLAMGVIGPRELAGHAIALQITATCFMVPLGLGQTATIRVGHAFGAMDAAGIGRAGWTACALATGFTAATAILLFAAPGFLVSGFVDPLADPDVTRLAVSFLFVAAIFQLADGGQTVGAGMLRGLQDTRIPMLIAAFGYWGIGAPLGLFLAFRHGLEGLGIWIGLAIGLAAVAAMMLWRWSARERLGLLPTQQRHS